MCKVTTESIDIRVVQYQSHENRLDRVFGARAGGSTPVSTLSYFDLSIFTQLSRFRAITQRRNELLRQMYYMIRRRDRAGSIVNLDDNDDGLEEFMDKFDLDKKYVPLLL